MLRAAAALMAAALVVGCSAEPAADVDRDGAGHPVEAGDVRADRIRVGDCFDDPEDDSDVSGFDVVPCDELHDNEVFHLFEVEDGEHPGRDALESVSGRRCADAFVDRLGVSVGSSLYDVFQIVPSAESWERYDDRTVVCALYGDGGVPLRGPARSGSGGVGDLDA